MNDQRTNQEWLHDLAGDGELQTLAIESLRGLMLRAARYTFSRNLGDLAAFSPDQIEGLAEECAQEALISLLKHLAEFRGESKFTTWAYKFAVNIALTVARRERWKGMSLDALDDFPLQANSPIANLPTEPGPELAAMRAEVWQVIHSVMGKELTEKQRQVMQWMFFEDVPMDVVVLHLNTNRNAVYKLLHDARSKLKQALLAHGINPAESIDLFSAAG